MQRSNITISDKNLRVCPNLLVVEQRQQPRCPISSTHANDRVHLAIREHFHQIRGPLPIAARQEAPASAHICSQPGFKSQSLQCFDRAIDRIRIRWSARGCNDSNGIAVIEARRFYWHVMGRFCQCLLFVPCEIGRRFLKPIFALLQAGSGGGVRPELMGRYGVRALAGGVSNNIETLLFDASRNVARVSRLKPGLRASEVCPSVSVAFPAESKRL